MALCADTRPGDHKSSAAANPINAFLLDICYLHLRGTVCGNGRECRRPRESPRGSTSVETAAAMRFEASLVLLPLRNGPDSGTRKGRRV
jgi:hypothetical protein